MSSSAGTHNVDPSRDGPGSGGATVSSRANNSESRQAQHKAGSEAILLSGVGGTTLGAFIFTGNVSGTKAEHSEGGTLVTAGSGGISRTGALGTPGITTSEAGANYGQGGALAIGAAAGHSLGGAGENGNGTTAGSHSTERNAIAGGANCDFSSEQCPLNAIGTWHLNLGEGVGALLEVQDTDGKLTARIVSSGPATEVHALSLDSVSGWLDFRQDRLDGPRWYRVALTNGVLIGRFASGVAAERPPLSAYRNHVTGWLEPNVFAGQPLVYDVETVYGDGKAKHRMRLTRGFLSGRFKQYAGTWGEATEQAVRVTQWKENGIAFTRNPTSLVEYQTYEGTYTGGSLKGFFGGLPDATWKAEPSQVLSYGLGSRGALGGSRWRTATRQKLRALTMSGDPEAELTGVSSEEHPVIAANGVSPDRDDDVLHHAQDYGLREYWWTYRHIDRFTQVEVDRNIHGFVATPSSNRPDAGFPLAIAINGHHGSAYQLFDPSSVLYWYGDAFARRGYVVIGVDLSHRSDSPLYMSQGGDDPLHGNAEHSSIVAPGIAAGWGTDWEEIGERAWDVLRAIDYAESRTDVDRSRVVMVGLEMGGETALLAAALDERITVAVVAGIASDLGVLRVTPEHPCYEWVHANREDYVDTSDLMALIAPRSLILETGITDSSSSLHQSPFASAKQAIWRAHQAFSDANAAGRLIHYLHDGARLFRVGESTNDGKPAPGVRVPMRIQPEVPDSENSESWQTDDTTEIRSDSLFTLIEELQR